MKHTLSILFILLSLSAVSQTTVTLQAGYSKSGDFHGAIGYKYNAAAIEAGFIGSPVNNDRPFFITSLLMVDFPISENWNISPIGGAAYKYFTAEKQYDKPFQVVAGFRISYKCFLFQYARLDKTNFFSLGMKPFTNDKY